VKQKAELMLQNQEFLRICIDNTKKKKYTNKG